MTTIEQFSLATGNASVYGGINLSRTGFGPQVRDYHVDRLPKYPASFRAAICPYCGKYKDRRAMRLDHIIPMAVWCRWAMKNTQIVGASGPVRETRSTNQKIVGSFRARSNGTSQHLFPQARVSDAIKAQAEIDRIVERERYLEEQYANALESAFKDDRNLILACAKCNGKKSSALPDEPDLDRVHRGNAHAQPVIRNYYDRARVYLSGTAADPIMLRNHQEMTRIRLHPQKSYYLHGHAVNVFGKEKSAEDVIEKLIVNRLKISRPDIELSLKSPLLMNLQVQSAKSSQTKSLRLCLYCLGLFHKQAFALDHIIPVLRRFGTDNCIATEYNDPTNLVAVCTSCNSSKGKSDLTYLWVKSRVEDRIAAGDPGLESTVTPNEQAKKKNEGLRHIKRVFGI